MKRLLTLWRADRGAVIIELAFVAPVIALMTIGVVDLSNGFGAKLRVEQAAHRSIEKVMQTTGVTSVETTIANEAVCQFNGTNPDGTCKTAPLTVDNVSVTHRLECDGVLTDAEDCAEDQVEAKWIRVDIWHEHEPLFPIHFAGINANGKYRVQATAGLRTE